MAELSPRRWYALAVHARQEKAAAAALGDRGVEVFLPLRFERRAWSDRVREVETALFPGYLFVHLALTARSRVLLLQVRQVADLVGRLADDAQLARAVPEPEIKSLKVAVASRRNLDPVARLVQGTLVRVVSGPLKGTRGVVQQGADGRRTLVVQIELLGRGVRTALSGDDVVEVL